MKKTVSLCIFLFLVFQTVNAAFVETVYTATLSTNQEVPSLTDPPDSYGTAVCVYNRNSDPQTLECEVQNNIANIISGAHIHLGARGFSGPVVYAFSGPFGENFKTSWLLEDQESYPTESQEFDFLSGNWYINVHTDLYPSGEIRGQLEHSDRFYSRLNIQNTIPRASGTSAHGIAVGTYSKSTPRRQLDIDVIHSVESPLLTGLELRTGRRGFIGEQVFAFSDSTSPAFKSFEYTISEEKDFLNDLHYLNIASERNPSGEIRGQVVTIDYIPEVSFTARLSRSGVNPPNESNNRGCGLFAYHCDTKLMEYLIVHNVPDARGAFLGTGLPGEIGINLATLSRVGSPIYGSIQFGPEEEILLYNRNLYVMISSTNFTLGEIRGQITVDNEFWAYLSGTNVVPPVTTPTMGCATFSLSGEQNRIFDYSIFHNVKDAVQVTLSVAKEGDNGPLDRIFPSAYSPIRGDDFILDDDELEALVYDATYVSVLSESHPSIGEIRGQIKRVSPCVTQNDFRLTVDENRGFQIQAKDGELKDAEEDNSLPIGEFREEIQSSNASHYLPSFFMLILFILA